MDDSRQRLSIAAVNVGLVGNALLAIVKTAVGIVGHSSALLADGINSTSDVAYYVVVRVFMMLAGKPADREHPFGHVQLESISALVVGSFVITTAVALFWDAVNSAYDLLVLPGTRSAASGLTLIVALATVIVKILFTVWTRGIGRKTNNAAVLALALDHRNDVFSAGAACIGIVLSRAGYLWVDPLAGALVALVVLSTGIGILRNASSDLMDTVPGDALDRQVRECLREVAGVQSVEEVQAHRFGPYFVLNVTVGIDGSLSVEAGDQIASGVEETLYHKVDLVRRVFVHYHPAGMGAT